MEHRRSWYTSFRPFQVRSDAACRADDIRSASEKKDVSLMSHSLHFHTHRLSHTTLSHTHTYIHTHTHTCIHTYDSMHACMHTYVRAYIHTYMHATIFSHTFLLCHTPSFTFHFVTHNCFNFSILHRLLATTFDAHYWKKLTCGVIRSFNSSVCIVFLHGFHCFSRCFH